MTGYCVKNRDNTVKLTAWEWDGSQKEGSSMLPAVCRFFSQITSYGLYECAQLSDSEDNEKRMHSCTCIEIRSLGHKR